mgnify:CR=1 FL=1
MIWLYNHHYIAFLWGTFIILSMIKFSLKSKMNKYNYNLDPNYNPNTTGGNTSSCSLGYIILSFIGAGILILAGLYWKYLSEQKEIEQREQEEQRQQKLGNIKILEDNKPIIIENGVDIYKPVLADSRSARSDHDASYNPGDHMLYIIDDHLNETREDENTPHPPLFHHDLFENMTDSERLGSNGETTGINMSKILNFDDELPNNSSSYPPAPQRAR